MLGLLFSQGWLHCVAWSQKGADLVYVFTFKEAAVPLKSLAPDLIVLPLLPLADYENKQRFMTFIKLASAVIIGPGLGRDIQILKEMPFILENMINKILVCDADFFWFLGQEPDIIKKLLRSTKQVILTPNVVEFGRLVKLATQKDFDAESFAAFLEEASQNEEEFQTLPLLEKAPEVRRTFDYFENPRLIIVIKHRFDLIVSKNSTLAVKTQGCRKRVGGLGDLLTGVLAQMVQLADQNESDIIDAIALSSYLLKMSAAEASRDRPISLIASDVLSELPRQVALTSRGERKSADKSADKSGFAVLE